MESVSGDVEWWNREEKTHHTADRKYTWTSKKVKKKGKFLDALWALGGLTISGQGCPSWWWVIWPKTLRNGGRICSSLEEYARERLLCTFARFLLCRKMEGVRQGRMAEDTGAVVGRANERVPWAQEAFIKASCVVCWRWVHSWAFGRESELYKRCIERKRKKGRTEKWKGME